MSASVRGLLFILTVTACFIPSNLSEARVNESPYFIKMKHTKLVSVSPKKLELFSTAVFYNTYKNKAKITELNIDLYLENRYLGKVINHNIVRVPQKSTFDIPIMFTKEFPASEIVPVLWKGGKLITGKKVRVRYSGYVKLKVMGFLPVRIRIEDSVVYQLY